MFAQHPPGVAQMLQHVAIDDAVIAVRRGEGRRPRLNVEQRDLGQTGRRERQGRRVGVDAEDAGARIAEAIDAAE